MNIATGQIEELRFPATLLAAVFLGFCLAYLFSQSIPLLFSIPPVEPVAGIQSQQDMSRVSRRSLGEYESIVTGNFFRDSIPLPDEENGDSGSDQASDQGEFTLQGVLAGHRSFARAAIQIKGENVVNGYGIGEKIVGYTIRDIQGNAISVERGGRRITVNVGEDSGEVLERQREATAVEQSGETTKITIPRSRIRQALQDQNQIANLGASPITRGNEIIGLRLTRVAADNILYQLGARPGDILRRINGQPLENAARLMQIFNEIEEMDEILLDIERAGRIMAFEIVVQ